jgi:hypothetical protein
MIPIFGRWVKPEPIGWLARTCINNDDIYLRYGIDIYQWYCAPEDDPSEEDKYLLVAYPNAILCQTEDEEEKIKLLL